jgi:cytochrome c peroxidase
MSRGLAIAAVLAALACKSGTASEANPGPTVSNPAETPGDAAQHRDPKTNSLRPAPALPETPLGLPERAGDPNRSRAAVALGRVLFFDTRLSASGRTSCASCHQPGHGWSDEQPRSRTDAGKLNARHTPSLWNVGRAHAWPWDGRARDLATMILVHWRGQLGVPQQAIDRIAAFPRYQAHFQRSYQSTPSAQRASEALAAFVSVLESGASPWDRYEAGDRQAVGPDAVAGFEVFRNLAQCALCHPPPLYTDHEFHRLGIADDRRDPGYKLATGKDRDHGAFKTPSLRGLQHTGPYLHDGSAATLEDVLDRKLVGGIKTGDPSVDQRLGNIRLTSAQRSQLLAFLRSLSRPQAPQVKAPQLPTPARYDAGPTEAPESSP